MNAETRMNAYRRNLRNARIPRACLEPWLLRVLTLVACLLGAPVRAQTGGSLTPPPGPPVPTMKSLDQIEPRTPLLDGAPGVVVHTNGSITITAPGSYYLTTNLPAQQSRNQGFLTANGRESTRITGLKHSHSLAFIRKAPSKAWWF